MEKKELLYIELSLDLFKGRKGVPVGTEKQWGGKTFVKTPTGWKPKTNPKEKKQEDPKIQRNPKEEDPEKRVKQIEEFATKATDRQLEAATKDPKQDQEVKDIAQAEIEKRNGKEISEDSSKEVSLEDQVKEVGERLKELEALVSKDIDKKKAEPVKEIKKTGIMLGGHKIFIVMNGDKTGYKTQGMKSLKLESKEGESLSDFKERIKQTWQAQQNGEPTEVREKQPPKKESEGVKEIKKTGIMVDGHKMFITMNDDKTGYVSKGYGLKLESKEGESLPDFKERVKQALIDKFAEKNTEKKEEEPVAETKKEEKPIVETKKEKPIAETKKEEENLEPEKKDFSQKVKEKIEKYKKDYPISMESFDDTLAKNFTDLDQVDDFFKAYIGGVDEKDQYYAKYRNGHLRYSREQKDQFKKTIKSVVDGMSSVLDSKATRAFKSMSEEAKNKALEYLDNTPSIAARVIMRNISGESSSVLLGEENNPLLTDDQIILARQLGVQLALVESNRETICLPIFCQDYNGETYNCYDRALFSADEIEDGTVLDKYMEEAREAEVTKSQFAALELYEGNSFYKFLTEYMVKDGKVDRMSEDALGIGKTKYGSVEVAGKMATEVANRLNSYIDNNRIRENIVLSRRVNPFLNEAMFSQMALLRKGDTSVLKSIQSFSYTQKDVFGDFQITLLAKKGDPIANAKNGWELEFISKQDTKFKVLETGYNSIMIELIP